MEITILGMGCPNCKSLESATREVVSKLGIEANITKEENIDKIMGYGVLRTPGLVIDGEVVHSGGIPSNLELEKLLSSR